MVICKLPGVVSIIWPTSEIQLQGIWVQPQHRPEVWVYSEDRWVLVWLWQTWDFWQQFRNPPVSPEAIGLSSAPGPSWVQLPALSKPQQICKPQGWSEAPSGENLASLRPILMSHRFPRVLSNKLTVQDMWLFYEFSKNVFCISVNIKRFPNVIVCLIFLSNLW